MGLAALIVHTLHTIEAGLWRLRFLRVLMLARYLTFYVQSYSDRLLKTISGLYSNHGVISEIIVRPLEFYPAHSSFSLILILPQPF